MVQIKNPVTIVQGGSPTPTPTVEEKDINFYDYDGTLVEGWTLAELANKTALPANPTHTGLTAQGWNWSLADLKTQNTKMNVGQMYVPTDGKTHLFVEVDADHLTGRLGLGLNGTATVDWGDGSATDTLTGTDITLGGVGATHTFATAGSYEITIDIPSGSEGNIRGSSSTVTFLWYSTNYQTPLTTEMRAIARQIKKIWVGERLRLGYNSDGCFVMSGLRCITIPNSVTDIYPNTFKNCYSLAFVTLPNSITMVKSDAFANCYSLGSVAIPNSVTYLESAFYGCTGLKSVTMPNSVVTVSSQIAFDKCYTLETVILPSSLTQINADMFLGCYNLSSLAVPSSVTNILDMAFSNCYATPIDFSNHTSIPTLGSIVFTASAGLVIKVPASLEASWKAASGWSDYASYIVGV